MKKTALALCCLLLSASCTRMTAAKLGQPSTPRQQSYISGIVEVQRLNGSIERYAGAAVYCNGTSYRDEVRSQSDGRFRCTVPAGEYVVWASGLQNRHADADEETVNAPRSDLKLRLIELRP